MKIALDALGGDYGIAPNVEGAVLAARDFDCEIILAGNEKAIAQKLSDLGYRGNKISITHAPSIIDMGAEPVQECREKPDSSIVVCADIVGKKTADAMISAGISGAAVAAALLKIGRLKGISRPALAVCMPTVKGASVFLDAGAIMECAPENLLEFAMMGSVYATSALGIKNPSVGLLSIGEEESKGNTLVKETIPLLKRSGLNFYGPVEGRDIHFGLTDVVVCDGFVGNIVLKVSEGLSKAIMQMVREEALKSPIRKLGALMIKGAFKSLKKRTDPDKHGGAPLLGIDGTVIICHGKSNSTAIYNAVKLASKLVKSKANEAILSGMKEIAGKVEAKNA
ncbi:MAG: phosphate acyltransferase PlsX [Elusimicrobia bacterium]|nr:phosphate acyltransferase PlsX [Elusimicrobiota bacterium]